MAKSSKPLLTGPTPESIALLRDNPKQAAADFWAKVNRKTRRDIARQASGLGVGILELLTGYREPSSVPCEHESGTL